jgi:hypothetical protein
MAQLTHEQYDALERAVMERRRVAIRRQGRREVVIIPLKLHLKNSREAIEARNPTTGDDLTIYLDDVQSIEVVR